VVSYSNLIIFLLSIIHFFQDHSYIAIAIITGKMLIISIHISLSSSSGPHIPENNGFISTEKNSDDIHSNSINPILTFDKDISLGSLLIARCCFGIASLNDIIYVVGMC